MTAARLLPSCLALALFGALAGPIRAQRAGELPPELDGVGITQKLDAQLPLDLELREGETPVRLEQFFRPGKPVILTLVYYRCPMLCSLVLNGLVEALRPIGWLPGREFEIVTLSIDPRETPDLARAKKSSYLASYGRAEAASGWHFLTGNSPEIDRLADAVGFRFERLANGEFAHAAAVYVLTPEGRLSRYLLGLDPEPQTLRLALVEASAGKIGSVVDQFLLYCYRYDAKQGRYTPVAWKIMRAGALLTVALLGTLIGTLLLRESRHRRMAR